ncbi:MAG: response regulator [Phenylobacterium sp.]|uniref:ATP-binding protein n=1 Tax=Phenylobacterium sp. TaxID=1871053 RepID=UPI001823AB19|nr:ATP-binding protein [Phenylobacterium sp.]MBA4793692.1 response regulator [Phenylobacterium sp.]
MRDGHRRTVDLELSTGARWLEVVGFRQRDAKYILPLTVLAAVGSLIWLAWWISAVWLAVNMTSQILNLLLCRRMGRLKQPEPRHELFLAAFTGVETVLYATLPAALLLDGTPGAAVAAMSIIGAIALSAASEIPLSRRIGFAALGASAAVTAAAILFSAPQVGALHVAVTLAAVASMYVYVVEAAFHREAIETRLAEAVAHARAKEAEAEAANAAKSAFLATMSHEIRTPLNGVLGMAQAMARDELKPAQAERLAIIRQSGETLIGLLNNVLDLSKIEAGQMSIEAIPFDLVDLLESTCAAFVTLAAEKDLSLELHIEGAADGLFEGDPTRLRQVVSNLVSNAVKFTERGGVSVAAELRPEGLAIRVADTGPGMDAEQKARLFSRFAQLEASITRRYGGTGLGLAISHELAGLMGGGLGVESEPGEGSVFLLALPLPRLGDRPEAPPEDPSHQAGVLSHLRVLAAEDNAVNQVVLKALLAPLGVDPVMVGDGAEAVVAWETGDWDLILMDVRMPVMDGLSATREIRAREKAQSRRRTRIIGLTADAMAHQVDELLAAGMDAHVAKPIEVERLYEALEAVA